MVDEQSLDMADIDEELLEIFMEEGADIIEAIEHTMKDWSQTPEDKALINDFKRPLHTLKGGARLAGLAVIGDLTHELESLLIGVEEKHVPANAAVVELTQNTVDELVTMLELTGEHKVARQNTALMAAIKEYLSPPVSAAEPVAMVMDEIDEELLDIFIEEGVDIIESIEHTMKDWSQTPEDKTLINDFKRPLHTLKGGARLAGLDVIGDLTHELESLLIGIEEQQVPANAAVVELTQNTVDELVTMLELTGERKMAQQNTALMTSIKTYLSTPVAVTEPVAMNMDEIDEELLDIFMEEGVDIIESIEQTMKAWVDAPDDATLINGFKRPLHTLKGGARLAGLEVIGDLTHELESLLIGIEERRVLADAAVIELTQNSVDELVGMLELASQRKMPNQHTALLASIQTYLNQPMPVQPDRVEAPQAAVVTETASEKAAEAAYETEYASLPTSASKAIIETTGLNVIRSVLLPMMDTRLLVPNAAVAEIIAYAAPNPIAQGPAWCVGILDWRGQRLPVVSYEAMLGEKIPRISRRARIAVCNAVSGISGLRFFGLICAHIPHLVRVHDGNIRVAEQQVVLPTSLQDVVVEEIEATIPRIELIEEMVRNSVPIH